MATVTLWAKGGTGGPAGLGNTMTGVNVAKHVIDINQIENGTNNVAATALGAADSVVVMNFPAWTLLMGVQAIITTTVDTSTTRIDLGDTGSATRFVNNYTTPYTAGSVITQATTTNPLIFYSAADKLLLKLTGTYTTSSKGVIRFVILTVDGSPDPISTTQS